MEYFSGCELTAAGTFVSLEGEFTLTTMDGVSILTQDKRETPYKNGMLTLTTHRLIWINGSRKSGITTSLPNLTKPTSSIIDKSSKFSSRARLLLRFTTTNGIRLEFSSSSDKDRLLSHLNDALSKKEWEKIAKEQAKLEEKREQSATYTTPKSIGISGIQQRVAERSAQQKATMNEGLESLEQLREQAIDLVRIAEALKHYTSKKISKTSSTEEDNNETTKETDELVSMMAEMGMESPVTRESTGGNLKVYRESLARQISHFLTRPVSSLGGIITISDAYCLVMRNRATTELVSPSDFRAAVDMASKLGLPIHVITLESGVDALELDMKKDKSGALALRKLAEERTSVTPVDVTRIRHIPIQRARAMLEDAEMLGLLVRDETTDGLRFFPNLFDMLIDGATKVESVET